MTRWSSISRLAAGVVLGGFLCATNSLPAAEQAPAAPKRLQQKDFTMEQHFLTDPAKILVRKDGGAVYVLSSFSKNTNIAQCFIEGNENCFFLPASAPMEDIWKGRLFAESWDNMGPIWFDRHGILGANHGSCFTFKINMLRHWLFEKDLGSVMTDDAGQRFVIVAVDDLCTFHIHSDIPDPGKNFCGKVTGALHLNGRTLVPEKITPTQMHNQPGKQLSPQQRYNNIELIIDGIRPAAENETVECDFAEFRWDMDLIFPEALIAYLKANPGHYVSPTDPRLESAIHYDMTTTFRPCGTRTVDCDITYCMDIQDSMRYGMLQFYVGLDYASHERLMPGMKSIRCGDQDIDLGSGYTFPKNFSTVYNFTVPDAINPARLPNRCIDFFSNTTQREFGVAVGYSETLGTTARGNEAERGSNLLQLYPTGKIYTFALTDRNMSKGKKHHIAAYQQFFRTEPSGISCYHHQRTDGYFTYADFPAPAERFEIALPAYLAGKAIEIIENDPAITLDPQTVPADGKVLLSAAAQGGIVLRIK